MAWIETVSVEDALEKGAGGPALARIYRAIGAARGGVAAIHRAQSLHPRALRAHLDLYRAVVLSRSSLSRILRERIAVVVSAVNRCRYCVAHHGEAARRAGDDEAVVAALERGELPEALPPGERALLSWARRATAAPWEAEAAHLEALRVHGYGDRALLDAALTVAYFSFVNRLVLLLGVELDAGYEATCGPIPAEPSEPR